MVHIINEYKGDWASGTRSTLETELRAVREEQQKLENKYFEMEKRSSELTKTYHTFLTQGLWFFLYPIFILMCCIYTKRAIVSFHYL